MKILIRNSDNAVMYADNYIELFSDRAMGSKALVGTDWQDFNFTTANSTIAEATPPEFWCGGNWTYINGGWAVVDQAQQDRFVTEETARLAVLAANVITTADLTAKAKRDSVVVNISPAEMASWPIKRAEALAFLASANSADAPNLGMEATTRGITLAALVGKVLTKAAQLSALEAAIAGRCGAIQDAAHAATTAAELAAIDANAGWPV